MKKPRKGTKLIFDKKEVMCDGYHSGYPDIMRIKFSDGKTDLIIWRFKDGTFNKYLKERK